MPHDLDQVLRNVNAPIVPQPKGMVARAILRDPQTRAGFRRRFAELATNLFVAPVLTQRIDQRAALLQTQLRDYDSHLALEVRNRAQSLKSRINGRAHYLASQRRVARPDSQPDPRVVR